MQAKWTVKVILWCFVVAFALFSNFILVSWLSVNLCLHLGVAGIKYKYVGWCVRACVRVIVPPRVRRLPMPNPLIKVFTVTGLLS